MNNLHEISRNDIYNNYISSILWWITVATYVTGDIAVVYPDNSVRRFTATEHDWGYHQKEDAILQDWIKYNKPEYRADRVMRG